MVKIQVLLPESLKIQKSSDTLNESLLHWLKNAQIIFYFYRFRCRINFMDYLLFLLLVYGEIVFKKLVLKTKKSNLCMKLFFSGTISSQTSEVIFSIFSNCNV